jgi:hypothetical protein
LPPPQKKICIASGCRPLHPGFFSRFRFDEGAAGHIAARTPERLDQFWTNRFGLHFGQIRASNLIRVGSHPAGWFGFQPLLARITRDEPDLSE